MSVNAALMGEAVDKFLAKANASFKNLIEHSDVQDQTALCKEFHQMLLAFLLQHDIVNAKNYCNDGECSKPRNQAQNESELMKRANAVIKRLIKKRLEKEREIEYLKTKLQTML